MYGMLLDAATNAEIWLRGSCHTLCVDDANETFGADKEGDKEGEKEGDTEGGKEKYVQLIEKFILDMFYNETSFVL